MALRRYHFSPWVVFIGLFSFVAWKLFEYHCSPDPRIQMRSQNQYWSKTPVKAKRGFIQDSKGHILALSVPVSSFFVDPDPSQWDPSNASALRGLVPENILKKISTPSNERFVWLVRRADPELAKKITALNLKGVHEDTEKRREYPNGSLLAHVLGFCDIDDRGLSGIELAWDSTLYEPPGYRILVRRSGGRAVGASLKKNQIYNHSQTLSAVTLTIDTRIQYVMEKHLNEVATEHKAQWGAAICMDPSTGAILAMSSWPTFNPNKRGELRDPKVMMNNAVGRAYEPGSTFKPIFMGIALEQGLVRANEYFNCPARLKVADGYISEAYQKAMGNITPAEILMKSSNVGMAQIGIRAKPVDMYRTLLDWGFGKNNDIELRGTEKGLLASPGQWRGVVPANISIGQGLAMSPLQLITGMAAVVNGGKLLSPYIVQEVQDSSGEVIYKGEPYLIRQVLSPEVAQWLRKAMRETVLSGTGRQANTNITAIAAKTGTAQVAEKGKYVKGRYVASFIGFWPYDDPQYLMLIVIGEPSSGKYYGGELAAPTFKKIVENMAELEIFKTDGGGRL